MTSLKAGRNNEARNRLKQWMLDLPCTCTLHTTYGTYPAEQYCEVGVLPSLVLLPAEYQVPRRAISAGVVLPAERSCQGVGIVVMVEEDAIDKGAVSRVGVEPSAGTRGCLTRHKTYPRYSCLCNSITIATLPGHVVDMQSSI